MKVYRMHPVNILENLSSFFWLLIFPLIRGLFTFRGGLIAWVQGAWFDLAVVLFIVLLATLRWAALTYQFDEEGILICDRFVFCSKLYVPYRKIACLACEKPFWYRPIHVVHLRADTNAGTHWNYDFALTVSEKMAEQVIKLNGVRLVRKNGVRRAYQSGSFYVALLAFISSNTLTGVLFVSAMITQSGNLLGKEFEERVIQGITGVAKQLAIGVPPIAALIGILLAGGWAVAFVLNMVRNYNFYVARQNQKISIRSGLFRQKRYTLDADRVNLIESKQTLTTKWVGVNSIFAHCSGYGKAKNELAVLIPAVSKKRLNKSVAEIVPEYQFSNREIYPHIEMLSRFLFPPVTIILVLAGLIWAGCYFLPAFSEVILFFGLMLEVLPIWWLGVKITSYYHTGVGVDPVRQTYTLRFTYAYGFYSVVVPKKSVVSVVLRQSMFQRLSRCCDLIVYTYSEGKKRHVVPNLPVKEAHRLVRLEFDDVLDPYYEHIPILSGTTQKALKKQEEKKKAKEAGKNVE